MSVKSALIKTGVIALGVGVGLGVVAVIAIAYWSIPKGWDKKSITATFDSVEFNLKPSPAAYYTYTLTNNTGKDFMTKLIGERHLPDNLRAAVKRGPVHDRQTEISKNALDPSLNFGDIGIYTADVNTDESIDRLANGEPLFIPAKQKVQVRLRWELPADELKRYGSVKIVNTSLFGFIVYDDATKYEIDFPKPPLLEGKQTDLDVNDEEPATATGYAPDRGEPWERYAACAEGQRLLPLCKQANIALDEAKIAADGWTPVGPLPTLPTVPKGATLNPGDQVCRAIYKWDYYCRKQMK